MEKTAAQIVNERQQWANNLKEAAEYVGGRKWAAELAAKVAETPKDIKELAEFFHTFLTS